MFRRNDDNENESLDFKEFTETVANTGLKLKTSELKQMFATFDKDGNGSINIDEFLLGLRVSSNYYQESKNILCFLCCTCCDPQPPMSEARKSVILEAFNKADVTGDGLITIEDLKVKPKLSCIFYYNFLKQLRILLH